MNWKKLLLTAIPREGEGAGTGGGDATAAAAAAAAAASKPWHDGLDPLLIGHAQNKGWDLNDPKAAFSAAAKSSAELQKHFGVPADQLLRLPKDTTDEAGWSAVRQRLGAPKEAKEYDFSGVKYADGGDLDQSFTDAMRGVLHKAGTPKEAAPEVLKTVVKWLGDADSAESAAKTARLQTEMRELDAEWGSNKEFNRLTAMQGARRAVGDDLGAKKLIDAMQDAIGYKATMEFWRKVGAGTSEDTFVEMNKGGSPTTMNGAKARIAELQADPDFVARYLKGSLKEVAEMNNLILLSSGVAA